MNKYFLILLFFYGNMSAISLVYNLRISQTTRRQAYQNQNDQHPFIISATPVGQFREYYRGGNDSLEGILGTFLYAPGPYYIRVDAAGGHVAQKLDNICFKRNQSDDILFMGGYSFQLSERSHATISGLFGVPTHKDTSLQGIDFGTGHIGIGVQADASFHYRENGMILGAARYIRFMPRNAPLLFENRCLSFKFNIGNVVDILIAHYYNVHKQQWIEVGYNPTFIFGARICPPLDHVIEATDYIRNSFYTFYLYGFSIRDVQSAVIAGFSYGFDSRSKIFGLKNIFTGWLSWGIKF